MAREICRYQQDIIDEIKVVNNNRVYRFVLPRARENFNLSPTLANVRNYFVRFESVVTAGTKNRRVFKRFLWTGVSNFAYVFEYCLNVERCP